MNHTTQKTHKGQQVGSHKGGTQFDHLIPERVHHIVRQGRGVLATVAIALEAPEDLRAQVGVREHADNHNGMPLCIF